MAAASLVNKAKAAIVFFDVNMIKNLFYKINELITNNPDHQSDL